MLVQYRNTLSGKVTQYDPETSGFFAIAFKDGCNGKLKDGRTLKLHFGEISSAQRTEQAAIYGKHSRLMDQLVDLNQVQQIS